MCIRKSFIKNTNAEFEISEEDMAAAALSFNVTEEDQDDDIELHIM